MAPSRILDSHIHLWPSTATTSKHHGWMSDGHVLAKRHGIQDYIGTAKPTPWGFVHIETDRYLASPTPDVQDVDDASDDEAKRRQLENWAKEPLQELRFLRRIVEGKSEDGDGFEEGHGALMKGCVVWAPFHLHPCLFNIYLGVAEEVAGPELWRRVVGFRYLLQGKAEGEVKRLVESQDWIENIVSLSSGRHGKGWAFDIGVDTHHDGVETLELVSQMVQSVREREKKIGSGQAVRFIFNHLCKPRLPSTPPAAYQTALSPLSSDPNTFMKLSGAFNEFQPPAPSDPPSLLSTLHPYLSFIATTFPSRILFGSDWPVCNVGGPAGEAGNWALWRDVVGMWVEGLEGGLERERVWYAAGCEAYGIEE